MKRNNKKGFTIVELVIVIAVIAILAGVLIPTFAGIVAKANASKALQEAQNAYKEAYALAIADGKIETVDEDGTVKTGEETQTVGDYAFTFKGSIDKITECTVKVKADSDAAKDGYTATVVDGVVKVEKGGSEATWTDAPAAGGNEAQG